MARITGSSAESSCPMARTGGERQRKNDDRSELSHRLSLRSSPPPPARGAPLQEFFLGSRAPIMLIIGEARRAQPPPSQPAPCGCTGVGGCLHGLKHMRAHMRARFLLTDRRPRGSAPSRLRPGGGLAPTPGFTLLEVAVVLLIGLVLIGLAAISFSAASTKASARRGGPGLLPRPGARAQHGGARGGRTW